MSVCLSVCMDVWTSCLSSLCDSVHGKGQHQLGQPKREVFQRNAFFPTARASLARDIPMTMIKPTLLQDTNVGLKNHEEVVILGPFQAPLQLVLPGIEPTTPHFTSRGNDQILSQRDPLQALGPLFCLVARRRCRADAGNTTSSQHCFTNLQIIFQN